jgi:8-oxo-dGTP diphosphatase
MPDRASSGPRTGRAPVAELHLVCCSAQRGQLVVLMREPIGGRSAVPVQALPAGEDPEAHAARAARELLGRVPAGVIDAGSFATDSAGGLAIAFAVVVPSGRDAPDGWQWRRVNRTGVPTGASDETQARAIERAVRALRERMDLEPIAFQLLANTFTLSELQKLYELLLGRTVHKASFRRSLAAAGLVQPIEEWRTQGRGRPAQLFRYAPRKARGRQDRPVRFELLR